MKRLMIDFINNINNRYLLIVDNFNFNKVGMRLQPVMSQGMRATMKMLKVRKK